MSRRCPHCGTSFPNEIFFCGHDGTITLQEQPPDDDDPRIGRQLGAYVAVARVADGATGRVYEGRHPQTKARTAIKVLHPDLVADTVAVERFHREFETAQAFEHPHIVKVLEFGSTEDQSYFMTMEYLEGEELGELLRREGAQPPARILRIAAQAAVALEHAHGHGVIHRDLKPDNIFLCKSEEGDVVKVLDFGSVKLQVEMGPKLTAYGTTLGSPHYMSPEQAMGQQDVDTRTDVFALAAILYEALTGQVAFDGSSVGEILMKLIQEAPVPPTQVRAELPPAFDDVIESGLAKDKVDRSRTPVELVEATARAFGLTKSAEALAKASMAATQSELAAAVPPEPKAYLTPPRGALPAPAAVSLSSIPERPSSRGALLGAVLIGGLLLVAAAVVSYLVL